MDLSPYSLCTSYSPASSFWEKWKNRAEQATQLKTVQGSQKQMNVLVPIQFLLKDKYLESFLILVW